MPDTVPDWSDWYAPVFPEPADVAAAAGRFPERPWLHRDGPVPRLLISPGVVRVEVADLAKRYDTAQRARRKQERDRQPDDIPEPVHDARCRFPATLHARLGGYRQDREEERRRQIEKLAEETELPMMICYSPRVITEWSRKSRSRMVRVLAELDYSAIVKAGRLPCYLTLTLPGAWETVAPSGKEFKRFTAMLRRRWERAWGEPLVGVWKLEFQKRGAPHLHVFTVMPQQARAGEHRWDGERYRPAAGDGLQLRSWLSTVWADVVDHKDPEQRRKHQAAGTNVDIAEGLRMTDPKRVSVYFSKHAMFRDKEYQHVVPKAWRRPGCGPGRFWGVWGLPKVTEACELTFDERIEVARTMRRYGHAQARARRAMTEREVIRGRRFRKVHRPVADRLQSCSGFLCVNDGPRLARALSRVIDPDRVSVYHSWNGQGGCDEQAEQQGGEGHAPG